MTTLTREQWEARKKLYMAFIDGSHHETDVDLMMLRHFGPRPDDAPSVAWESEYLRCTLSAAFIDGQYIIEKDGITYDDKTAAGVANQWVIPDDATLTALLALNPDGEVARLRDKIAFLEREGCEKQKYILQLERRIAELERTPAPTNATPLGFIHRYLDSDIGEFTRNRVIKIPTRYQSANEAVYPHAQTEAELVAALEGCGWHLSNEGASSHKPSWMTFTKRAGGGA